MLLELFIATPPPTDKPFEKQQSLSLFTSPGNLPYIKHSNGFGDSL